MQRPVIPRRSRERRALSADPRARLRTRIAAGVIALGIMATGLSQPPEETEALWADGESGRATFTALTVPVAPYGGDCGIVGSLLNLGQSTLTIRWRLPAGYALADARISYTGSNGLVPAVDTLLGTSLRTTQSNGVYTTVLSGALLNAVLGASRSVSVQIAHPSGWISPARTVVGNWPLLGLGTATCSMTPAA
ncbi:hypothetical protein [Leucobacter sp. L43]|uniref:hypothetical protein n=1 Tax=Leucobacter sp. L43 TaxID=2798040 RepID=UPI000A710CE9|nr:hypothetical protein [Leucobacter sp. L43]